MSNWLLASVAIMVAVVPAAAQGGPKQVEVYQSVAGSWSKNLREMAKGTVNIPGPAQPVFLGRIPFSGTDAERQDAVEQTIPLPSQSLIPTVGQGFEGLGSGAYGFNVQYAPPDTNGAAGTTQYVQWVNASFAVFDKASGNLLAGPIPGNAPWQGFGGGCETNNDGDPIVQFDKLAQRWVFTQFSVSNKPYLQCFAISESADATGAYFRFAFSFGNRDFPDYPKLGIMPNGYYMSFNIFRNGFLFTGPRACAVDRNRALSGVAPSMVCFSLSSGYGSLLPADLDGATAPSDASQDFFIAYGSNVLQVWKLRPNWSSPSSSTLTGPANLAVAAFTRACSGGTCIPQPGTSQQLDSLADRLMYRLAYRNLGGTESMVVNHSVKSGAAASAIRWYELRVSGGNASLFQQGTFAPLDNVSRWMGSIAMDMCGDIAVGYSVSDGTDTYPGIRTTGRVPTDPAGQLQTETTLMPGSGSQTQNLSRWGDYSAMSVDPVDDSTFWFTTEYMASNGTFNWHTRIVPMKFSTCP
jgi:hypothetical protein